jgi:hypothetical protein
MYYQEYLALPHEDLAKLAAQMRVAGEKLGEEYKVMYQSCEQKMETMAQQAQQAVVEPTED